MKKVLSVLICVLITFSAFSVCAFAEEKNESELETALENLERDVPLIYVVGLGGQYYSGILTETEEDDVRIWEPTGEIILPVLKEYGFSLVWNILKKDYVAANQVLAKVADGVFGPFSCNADGVPDPDTAKKEHCTDTLQKVNGYDNTYTFLYDWRLDVVTLAEQLGDYVQQVMELTGSDKVAFVAASMGNSILMTYLYKSFYTQQDGMDFVHSAVFVAGTMNGAASCEDPFSLQMTMDAESIVRYVECLAGRSVILRALYSLGIFEPVLSYVRSLVDGIAANGLYDAIETTLATISGFHALMSAESYEKVRAYMYDTAEKQEKFAKILESSDYFHREVQPHNADIIQKLIAEGKNVAVFSQYGYSLLPITSDNARLSDGTIAVDRTSFGATCSELDGTLGENYVQAVDCACGESHLSPDGQIDASTCCFADVTWFGKKMFHVFDTELLATLVDLVTYSEEQITVHTFEELPQFLVREGDTLIPMTSENCPTAISIEQSIAQDEEALQMANKIKIIAIAVLVVLILITVGIVLLIVRCVRKRRQRKKSKLPEALGEEISVQ